MSEDEERVARELAEELGKLRVENVLVGALVQVSAIGYRRLGLTEDTKDDRDLEQTKIAIDTMRALTPVLEHVVPAELIRDFNQSVANLQLAYAKALSDTSGGQAPGHGEKRQEAASDAPAAPVENSSDKPETDMPGCQAPGHGERGQDEG